MPMTYTVENVSDGPARLRRCALTVLLCCVPFLHAADDVVIADFEGADYGDWQVEGDAFGPGPAQGTLARQNPVSGFLGKGLVNTYYKGDGTTGCLTSPQFAIERPYITFLIGGGKHPGETFMTLLVGGKPVRAASGPGDGSGSTERLSWCAWDVQSFVGQSARIQIVDEHRGGWGHINVDEITQSTQPKSGRVIRSYTGPEPIAGFESDGFEGWQVEGEAFGSIPAGGKQPGRRDARGYHGRRLLSSRHGGDKATGTLTSPEFEVTRAYINFRVGGGNWPGMTCVDLLIDGKVRRSSTGDDSDALGWHSWDVSEFAGRRARIRAVDRQTYSRYGFTMADSFSQSNDARTDLITGDPEAQKHRAVELLGAEGVQEVVFAARKEDPDGHWYANFSTWSNNPNRRLYHDGGRLCRLDLRSGKVTVLVDDPTGGVRDPQVHYDGTTILFSYRRGGQPYYHLYEIKADGNGLRQLTDGPFDDIEPVYLPDGGIVFGSSRCKRMVNCYYVRVAVIHRCDGDGNNIRMLSSNIEHDNTPWVLPDGRILHQRWEYIDRSQVAYHHLWTMNPDGTSQMVYYGNLHPSTVMIDAKPIPGTNQVVASFSPGHGRREHAGTITVVDPGLGPDAKASARSLRHRGYLRDPYPLSATCFMVAGSTHLLAMDANGWTGTFYDLPAEDKLAGLRMHEPRPLRPRLREPVIPSRVDLSKTTGTVFCTNVHEGRNMAGVTRGEIKELLVLEALPKPVNFTGGWEPITYGGSFTLERILGTVPVAEDGSVHVELPALRSLFFVALDKDGLAVKRMQSFLTLQPGEVFGCVGCHEPRTKTILPSARLSATRRPPSRVEPIAGVPELIDFPRDIQPVLDRHCIACHNYDATEAGGPRSGGVILSADRGPHYSHSYVALTIRGQISDGRNLSRSNYPPRTLGSSASRLLAKVDGSHHGVRLSSGEQKLIRLWIDSAAAYPGTYAALGSGMIGGRGWGEHTDVVLQRRCATCHSGRSALPRSPGDSLGQATSGRVDSNAPCTRLSRHVLFNLTRPERSLLLLAPLAASAGGYAAAVDTKPEARRHVAVFAGPDDADYQVLLAAVRKSQEMLNSIKRFDMDGFRPNTHYIREMTFYGILPQDRGPENPVDVYATDRSYWRSLWYEPMTP